MDELQATLGPSKTSNTSKRLPSTSPMAQKIRQQILKSDEMTPPQQADVASEPSSSVSRKQRLQNSRFTRTSTTTPTAGTTAAVTKKFWSPSPATTPAATLPQQTEAKPKNAVSASTKTSLPTITRNESRETSNSSGTTRSTLSRKSSSSSTLTRVPLRPLATPSSNDNDGEDNVTTRRNLDKRTARLLHSQSFASHIEQLRQGKRPVLKPKSVRRDVSVLVRKRPLFPHDVEQGDFDVVQVDPTSICVYKTQLESDMKTKSIQPYRVACSAAFGETATTDQLYQKALEPIFKQALRKDEPVTILMFGQTGSGKTWTMTGIEQQLVKELFRSKRTVRVHYLELSGKQCQDLMDDSGTEVRIMENSDGSTRFFGAKQQDVTTADVLTRMLAEAKARRATEETERNAVSSRSHAICRLTVLNAKGQPCRGVISLVDCAGTERNNDSMYHSHDRQVESAEINSSLYALKECIRARMLRGQNKEVHVPYRMSNLTRILQETFESKDGHLSVIATVAPNATDTEHTIQTLRTISTLLGEELNEGKQQTLVEESPKSDSSEVAPKKWTNQQVVEFLTKKNLLGEKAVPWSMDGRQIMRMTKLQLRNTFYNDSQSDKADTLYQCLRAESDRIEKVELKRRMSMTKSRRI